MKRNKEVVLKLLTMVEADTNVEGMPGLDLFYACEAECDNGEMAFARLLLVDSGYLVSDGNIRITWTGYELLEELRG